MRTHDSMPPNDEWLDVAISNVTQLSDDVVEAAWERFQQEHISPGRLMQLAFELAHTSQPESAHLRACTHCRNQFECFEAMNGCNAEIKDRSTPATTYRNLRLIYDAEASNGNGHHIAPHKRRQNVPNTIREHVQFTGPVIMPGEDVSLTTWQFGAISDILKYSHDEGKRILNEICDTAFDRLQERPSVSARAMAFVCFGRTMHRCGIELATRFYDAGLGLPHVILAHDYYDPCLVCSPSEFVGTDVVVLVDVVHSGNLLRRLVSACESFNPKRVTGLALIDQSPQPIEGVSYQALWFEDAETRIPLAQFLHDSPSSANKLRRFEANSQCAIQLTESIESSQSSHLLPDIDSQLLVHILATDALKCDYPIYGKTYPFVVNVLDLIKKDGESRRFIGSCFRSVLADLAFQKTCLAFHVGRSQRAGQIARLISEVTSWPSIPIGTKGSAFALNDKQCRRLACFDNVVIVDAAIRTGETISAITRAVLREAFQQPRIIACTVLNALPRPLKSQLCAALNIEIRSLFDFPLTPPTEEIRHWVSAQKTIISDALQNDPAFESVQPILVDYCDLQRNRGRRKAIPQSRSAQMDLARRAVAYGRSPQQAAKDVAMDCQKRSARAIRHLPVSDVIRDSAMQSMLIGVMYNSVPAPLKESAVFGLAAAENYDWMNLQWLKCNRRFLCTKQSWKSVLLVGCQMKLSGRMSPLREFKSAALKYRNQLEREKSGSDSEFMTQQSLFAGDEFDYVSKHPQSQQMERKLVADRLGAIIELAG
jgi:hypothetical protein